MASQNLQGKLARLQAKLVKIEAQKLELERKHDERFLALIKQSGLYNLDVTAEEVLAGFNDLAGRFRGTAKKRTVQDHPSVGATPADVSTPD